MQVTEINADGLSREFKVVVPAALLNERLQGKLAQLAGTVRIPGFRPGKVPLDLVRKKYGQAVMGEVLEQAVNDAIGKAIEESSLRPASQPKVDITTFSEGADLEFSLKVEVLPEITLMDFATIALERDKPLIADAEIDRVLAGIAERNGDTETVDRAAASGDTVVIDFEGKLDGTPFAGGKADGYTLKLGSNTFIPGFEDQVAGLSAGESKVIAVTFPEGYGNEELAGKAATFDVTVTEVKSSIPATVDDDLAKAVGMDSLDALKQAIRDEVGRDLVGAARMKLKRALLDVLAENHDFAVPPSMLETEFTAIWKQVEDARAADQADPADAGKSEDELRAEYRALAERRVRLGLLLAEVGRVSTVTITQEDLNRAILAEARAYPGQEHLVLQYYQKNEKAIESLRAPVYEEKVVDHILAQAQITEREIDADEMRRALEAEAGGEADAHDHDHEDCDCHEHGESEPKERAAHKKTDE